MLAKQAKKEYNNRDIKSIVCSSDCVTVKFAAEQQIPDDCVTVYISNSRKEAGFWH